MSVLFLNILTLLAPTQSADNLFRSCTILCENSFTIVLVFGQVLETGHQPASGGVLVLVSDGWENIGPYIDEVKPTLRSKGVIVHTILTSDDAEPKLVELAAYTRGKSFFDSGASDSTNLQSAFRTTVKEAESESPGVAPVEVG